MEMSFFASVLPWLRAVGVSKRRTQAATLVLRLMGRCAGLKRPCTGLCLEGRAKKDISMLTRAFLSYITPKRRLGSCAKLIDVVVWEHIAGADLVPVIENTGTRKGFWYE